MNKNNTVPKIKGIKKIKVTNNYNKYYIDGTALKDSSNLILTNPFPNKKTVYYIIENGNFVNGLYLHTDVNTNVVFKNCSFHEIICINSCGNVEFNSNRYYADAEYPTLPKYFFNCRSISLRFTEDIFSNSSYQTPIADNNVGMNINAKFLLIDESLIKFKEENSKIKIKTQEITVFNSTITAPIINLNSDDIYSVNSNISSQFLNITNKNNSELEGIEADNFTYNGETLEKAKVFTI